MTTAALARAEQRARRSRRDREETARIRARAKTLGIELVEPTAAKVVASAEQTLERAAQLRSSLRQRLVTVERRGGPRVRSTRVVGQTREVDYVRAGKLSRTEAVKRLRGMPRSHWLTWTDEQGRQHWAQGGTPARALI